MGVLGHYVETKESKVECFWYLYGKKEFFSFSAIFSFKKLEMFEQVGPPFCSLGKKHFFCEL